ncbi:uncharacterized protein BDW47DRAFT_111975 [Aspergillus candidus]|uniref:CUE domain-containing protein n=1 Tax=Aspergillus candidus TaxID=41067 RepID=A0A2I2F1X3_ASPCN|nr:hypothetical protein BDW47DRAFT_111975 [Aspergillus candidus]PLB34617.1 hypothetical protein BDW47DRAFT_111975 [Aspergillus candidus]
MSEEDRSTPSKPSGPISPKPESPTTARPLDFDDEPQESGVTSGSTSQQNAPPKPPRPLSPQQQAENTLKEAFPSIEGSVVKAVLVASGWDVERAFHALLGMTDPSAADTAPPKPPRPTAAQRQLEADELYARQLAEHYNRRAPPTQQPYSERPRRGSDLSDEREYSFFDDDLPVIRDNLRKGFFDTQTKVSGWFQDLKKRIDGEEEDGPQASHNHREAEYSRARRSGDMGRRSGDRERYDADPQLLSDDFSALELRDGEAPPPRPPRPLAGSNLSKRSSPSPDRRKVSFQEGPPTEINDRYSAPASSKQNPSAGGGKSSKWQPLSTMEPSPVADNDPFSLGDSDDEKDPKPKENSPADEGSRTKKDNTEATTGDAASKDNKTEDASKS